MARDDKQAIEGAAEVRHGERLAHDVMRHVETLQPRDRDRFHQVMAQNRQHVVYEDAPSGMGVDRSVDTSSRSIIGGGALTMASEMPTKENASASLDRRIERAIEQARRRSAESHSQFYQANQLSAFLDCLPRRLPEAAAEGLRLILDRAGF